MRLQEYVKRQQDEIAALNSNLKERDKTPELNKFLHSAKFEELKKRRATAGPFDDAPDIIAGEFEDGFKWWFVVPQLVKILAVVAELYLELAWKQVVFMLVILSASFSITFVFRPFANFPDYMLEVTLQAIQVTHLMLTLLISLGLVERVEGGYGHAVLLILSVIVTILALSGQWEIIVSFAVVAFNRCAEGAKFLMTSEGIKWVCDCKARERCG